MIVNEPIRVLFQEELSRGEFSWPAESSLISAGSMLKREEMDMLRLSRNGILSDEALTGYSIISTIFSFILYGNIEGIYDIMFQECGKISAVIDAIDGNAELSALLKKFAEVRFGHLLVKMNGVKHHLSIYDVIGLYEKGKINTELSVGEVSSSVLSMPSYTTLPELLSEMIGKRVRRIFVEGTSSFVSDRVLISYFFSTSTINMLRSQAKKIIDVRLSDLGPIDAISVNNDMKVADAAKLLARNKRDCLLCNKGIITHWDCVIKPFLMGKMEL
jgi:hypothetical protein